jgi:hypothetical protein
MLRFAACGLCLAVAATAATPAVPTLPLEAVRPGQQALVRTVMAGDSIETFEAEIVGILPGGRAQGELILARATSPHIERTGVAQGMSGSPVYVDGRLVGALAYSWPFSREPVFGITPIAEMLAVLEVPESAADDESVGPIGVDPGPTRHARVGEFRWADEPDSTPHGATTRPARAGWLPLPLAVGGAGPAAFEHIRDLFEPEGFAVVPAGRDRTSAPGRPPEPGDAIAVDLLRGDLDLSAIGTLTYRDGDRVLVFGHPFFQSGEVRLPLSTARITTTLGRIQTSFKLGSAGRAIGTITQDRRAALAGRLGSSPRLLPLRVEVRSAASGEQRFRFEAVEDRSLLPQLVMIAAANSLLESGGVASMQTVRWSLDVWKGGRRLALGDMTAGDTPLQDVLLAVSAPVRFLAGNPHRRFTPDSLVLRCDVRPGRAQAALRSAALARATARPGGVARVRLELERWRGGAERVELEVPVPEELPDGRYQLWIGGGEEADRFIAGRLPGRYRVVSLEDAWQRLATGRRADAIHAVLWARAAEVSLDGEDLPELPVSALAVLGAPQQAGDRLRRGDWAMVQEVRAARDEVVRGQLLMELVVDGRAP